jgi:hypothetical protein
MRFHFELIVERRSERGFLGAMVEVVEFVGTEAIEGIRHA